MSNTFDYIPAPSDFLYPILPPTITPWFPWPDPYPDNDTVKKATGSSDVFVFHEDSTGDIFKGDADLILGFDASEDKIHIPDGLTYGGATSAPAAGTFSVWQKGDNFVVTWKDEKGWNDVEVQGDNPKDAVVADAISVNQHVAWIAVETFYGGEDNDFFVFASDTTGDLYQNAADTIMNFDADHDQIHIPDGLSFAGETGAPAIGQYSVWENGGKHVVTWKDADGYHDIYVDGDDPEGHIVSGADVFVF